MIHPIVLFVLILIVFFYGPQLGAQDKTFRQWNQLQPSGITENKEPQFNFLRPPSVVWQQKLGPGHSMVLVDNNGFGFCHYLLRTDEVVRKFSLETGKTSWEKKIPVRYQAFNSEYAGPHATPAMVGNVIIVVSIDAQVTAVDVETGATLWNRDLCTDFGTKLPQSGYASSPMIGDGLVFIPTLGQSQPSETETYVPIAQRDSSKSPPGMIAVELETGRLVWKSNSFRSSHASPILVEIGGYPTIVIHGMFELIGLDPKTGRIVWTQLLRRQAADNVSFTPVWDAKNRQFLLTHGYCENGTQAVAVSRDPSGNWNAKVNWMNRQLKSVHTNGLIQNGIFMAINREPATLLVGIDAATGTTLFRQRGFGKGNLVQLGENLMLMNEDGNLIFGQIGNQKFTKSWKVKALDANAWTIPTVTRGDVLLRDSNSLKRFQFQKRLP
ncbi:MAG: PQQ-binding-like beta-propeller repeat protein [Planctomycetota bacterium]